MEINLEGETFTLDFSPEISPSQIETDKQNIILTLAHMVDNSFSNNEAKEYLKDKIDLSDQVKNYLYVFFKRQLQELIQKKRDKVATK